MSIRFKAAGLIFSVIFIFIISLYALNKNIITPRVESYEIKSVIEEAEHINRALLEEGRSLNYLNAHLINSTHEIGKSNGLGALLLEYVQLENIDFIIHVDQQGQVPLSVVDPQLPPSHLSQQIFEKPLSQTPFLRQLSDGIEETFISGLYPTTAGLALVSAITNPDSNGQQQTLIIGKLIDEELLDSLQQKDQYIAKFTLEQKSSVASGKTQQRYRIDSTDNIKLSTSLPALVWDSELILELTSKQEIRNAIENNFLQSMKISLLFCIIITISILMFLNYQIIKPLRALFNQMSSLQRFQTLPANPYLGQKDEIGRLCVQFQDFVRDIDVFRKTLHDGIYDKVLISLLHQVLKYTNLRSSEHQSVLKRLQSSLTYLSSDALLSSRTAQNPEQDKDNVVTDFQQAQEQSKVEIGSALEMVTLTLDSIQNTLLPELIESETLLEADEKSFSTIIEHAMETFSPSLKEHVDVKTHFHVGSLRALKLQHIAIEFMITELLRNSLQALLRSQTTSGLTLEVSTSYHQKELLVTIKDHGIAMSENAIQEHLNQRQDSMLSWVNKTAHILGGHLQLSPNDHQEGMTQTLYLPMPLLTS